ncbi:bifunctional phosphoribosyl-AMP cyclohydrolase/phosphoribosyl-ATP diphosphatase HisIE [Moorella sp. Hama-1]|uniref:bifunctional phosphoribosyl-AMP cyclohydrolase/phosphoribosyl-ATP diphosphatase HisIE n=1 Tax=Moorella sp. Hama-1 TaxID=2138101 RepID=UPI000D65055F|nr:bifunctional phosphoribosyl-AMP cyclohydrolase/phosphoribosyl-ATP diphosphatase HisIE [Moorella sp. Hama-1]BCV22484.1 histidine biosynthesis bifunctional protein HisIE [Moorella sp. Hama-1]
MGVTIPDEIRFNADGLIPAIIQDVESGQVLMLAYMNRESLARTLATGETWFYSRSRRELWHKGATSGHRQYIAAASYDCDADTLLFQVRQVGVACHEGEFSCFHNPLPLQVSKPRATASRGEVVFPSPEREKGTAANRGAEERSTMATAEQGRAGGGSGEPATVDMGSVINEVFQVIKERQATRPEGSYTAYLFNNGQDKILKKIGEEAGETIIASKNDSRHEILYELADLYYHTLVLLAYHDLEPGQLAAELAVRR